MRYLFVFSALAFAQVPQTQLIADLTDLIERKPDFVSAYHARGRAYLSARQYWMAELDLSKAIELGPEATIYASRAEVYAATRRPDAEIADLTKAIAMKPGFGSYYLRRANSYRSKEDCTQAISDYSQVILMVPNEEAYRGRAACRRQLGDAAGAVEDDHVLEQIGAGRASGTGVPLAAMSATPLNRPAEAKASAPVTFPGGVYRIGGGVSQPSILFKVEPEYSEEARKAKWQGTVRLSVVVSEFGEAKNINVEKSLGLGLDEEAIAAVQKWVFKPGRKAGQPVSVFATIEVTFHLL